MSTNVILVEDHDASFHNVMALLFEREGIKVVGQAGTLAETCQLPEEEKEED